MFNKEQSGEILDSISSKKNFTAVVNAPRLRRKDISICFLSFSEGEISHAALVERDKKVVTAQYKYKFFEVIELALISFDAIQANIEEEFKSYFAQITQGAEGYFSYKEWKALWNAIIEARNDNIPNLQILDLELLLHTQSDISHIGFDVMAQEKDAVGLAVDIFGLDRSKVLSPQMFDTNQPAPFLSTLESTTLIEDTMINHDATIFGDDWNKIEQFQVGASVFQKRNGERLTVMNVNRTSVEHTLGVDLLYYHHRYHSFVMVQYKRMVKESNSEAGYRPIGENIKEEFERMRHFEDKTQERLNHCKTEAYRLHKGTFYFKLCPAVNFNPCSTELIQGMYLPLDYWEILLNSPQVIGKRGGTRITKDNIGRYINNTGFVELVQSGWIGSNSNREETLSFVINGALQGDQSLILAYSQPEVK